MIFIVFGHKRLYHFSVNFFFFFTIQHIFYPKVKNMIKNNMSTLWFQAYDVSSWRTQCGGCRILSHDWLNPNIKYGWGRYYILKDTLVSVYLSCLIVFWNILFLIFIPCILWMCPKVFQQDFLKISNLKEKNIVTNHIRSWFWMPAWDHSSAPLLLLRADSSTLSSKFHQLWGPFFLLCWIQLIIIVYFTCKLCLFNIKIMFATFVNMFSHV